MSEITKSSVEVHVFFFVILHSRGKSNGVFHFK